MKQIKKLYLDNAATTPLSNPMKLYLTNLLDIYANPSSLYSIGEQSKQIITTARESVSNFINGNINDIFFTPSGSASNTLAIRGYISKHNCNVLYSPIAHKSILQCVGGYKYSHPLKVNREGFIDFDDLKEWMPIQKNRPLVIIDYANSEIGTIQNVKRIIDLVHFYNGIVYLDCTGSISTIPINVKKLDVDMLGFSAHKLNGLKGCGVLWKKSSIELEPLVYGTQEQGLIGGTENILGIASLGMAVKNYNYSSITSKNRDYVYDYITNNISDNYIIGASIKSESRLTHNLYICFPDVEGESLMLLLDANGIQVSTGSACSSGNLAPSTTLVALGIKMEDIHSCIRMTFSGFETKEELDYVCKKLKECVKYLRKIVKE